jgi:hypothetical protein
MAVQITCSCGKRVSIPDQYATRKVVCPACRAVLAAPAAAAAPAREAPAAAPKRGGPAAPPAGKDVAMEVIVEPQPPAAKKGGRPAVPPAEAAEVFVEPDEGAEPDKAERKRKRGARARRRGLERVTLGLAVHYAAVFLVYAGLWASIVAVLLTVAYRYSEGDKTLAAMTFFYCAAAVCLLLTGLVQIATFVLCLAVPDGAARKFLIGSQAVWPAVFGLAVWAMFPGDLRLVALGGAILFLLGSWALWMFFLQRAAYAAHQPDIADETLRALWRGLGTMLGVVLILIAVTLYIMLIIYVEYKFVRILLISISISVFLGMLRIAAATRFFESVWHFLLFPTGFLSVLKYLDLLGSLRLFILRRS